LGYDGNTVLHFAGLTSMGKTTGAHGAASVWGPPRRYVSAWCATTNALEGVAQSRTHTGLILDEIKALQPHEAGVVAYMLASGSGKNRMRPDSSMRPVREWETMVVSTGEKKLADHARSSALKRDQHLDPGTAARIIDLEMTMVEATHGFASSREFVQAFAAAARAHHGHAGPAFVGWLAAHQDQARRRLAEHLAAFKAALAKEEILPLDATAQAERIAGHFGTLAAAGALAAEVLDLPWHVTLANGVSLTPAEAAVDAAIAGLREWVRLHGGSTVTGTDEAAEELVEFIIAHQARFGRRVSHASSGDGTPDETPSRMPLVGWFVHDGAELSAVALLPSALDDAGWPREKVTIVMRHLRDKGWLMARGDELRTTHRSNVGANVRVYKIKGAFFGPRLGAPRPDPDDPRTWG
jgi:hypothetical protein